MLIKMRDECARPGTICASFSVSEMPSMSMLHVCVDLSLYLSGRLSEIVMIDGCKLFTGFPES